MEPIVIIGASGHAGVVIDIVEREKRYKIVGLLDLNKPVGADAFGYPVLGQESDLPEIIRSVEIIGGIIAIGDNWTRHLVKNALLKSVPDFPFVSAIHPSVQIGTAVTVGKGTVVMPNCVLNRNVKIGNFCILNTAASIDHDSQLGDFSSLAPGARTGGNVRIGSFTAVGLGANVIHGISIGSQTVIGAGAVVTKDVPDLVISYGIPAKVIRERVAGEKYL